MGPQVQPHLSSRCSKTLQVGEQEVLSWPQVLFTKLLAVFRVLTGAVSLSEALLLADPLPSAL